MYTPQADCAHMWQCWRCDFLLCQKCAKKRSRSRVCWAALQQPEWFTSHWWGEPVDDFVSCVVTHALAHYPWNNDTTGAAVELAGMPAFLLAPYWVCAYANNQ